MYDNYSIFTISNEELHHKTYKQINEWYYRFATVSACVWI